MLKSPEELRRLAAEAIAEKREAEADEAASLKEAEQIERLGDFRLKSIDAALKSRSFVVVEKPFIEIQRLKILGFESKIISRSSARAESLKNTEAECRSVLEKLAGRLVSANPSLSDKRNYRDFNSDNIYSALMAHAKLNRSRTSAQEFFNFTSRRGFIADVEIKIFLGPLQNALEQAVKLHDIHTKLRRVEVENSLIPDGVKSVQLVSWTKAYSSYKNMKNWDAHSLAWISRDWPEIEAYISSSIDRENLNGQTSIEYYFWLNKNNNSENFHEFALGIEPLPIIDVSVEFNKLDTGVHSNGIDARMLSKNRYDNDAEVLTKVHPYPVAMALSANGFLVNAFVLRNWRNNTEPVPMAIDALLAAEPAHQYKLDVTWA